MIYDKHAAAAFAVTAVRDWSLGYSQGDERTDIRDGGSADCSSLVAAAVNVGYGNAASTWAPRPPTSWPCPFTTSASPDDKARLCLSPPSSLTIIQH